MVEIMLPKASRVKKGKPGIHKAGNDCDASEAGLQGEQARR